MKLNNKFQIVNTSTHKSFLEAGSLSEILTTTLSISIHSHSCEYREYEFPVTIHK